MIIFLDQPKNPDSQHRNSLNQVHPVQYEVLHQRVQMTVDMIDSEYDLEVIFENGTKKEYYFRVRIKSKNDL
jgi:hypothetical protein